MLTPYTSITTTRETNTNVQQQQQQKPLTPYRSFEYNSSNLATSPSLTTIAPQPPISVQTQSFRTPLSPYQPQPRPSPPNWRRTETNLMNQSIGYASEPTNDYIQRDFYLGTRPNLNDRTFEQKKEPRVLHYYTGYDYFATVDPSDAALTKNYPSTPGPGSAIRYGVNPSYRHQNDYIKSTM
jgi:hypothetical protein